jgi:probable Rubsico expression protein CbbX
MTEAGNRDSLAVAMPSLGPGYSPRAHEPAVEPAPSASEEVDPRFRDLADPLRHVPDEAAVPATDVLINARVEAVIEQLDRDLVALDAVKRRVRELAALLAIGRLRRRIGLDSDSPTLHMSFTGNPGTGKTTVAMRMGRLLYELGYVSKGHLVVASREDLVGQYVGHTSPKTREVIKRAMGGVLFIDEAYSIYRLDNERDYGQETVDLLLQVMENERENLVIIFAGYKDKMERFFSDVPGISSRIAHHIDFPDYDLDELMAIARLMVEGLRYRLSADGEGALSDYLALRRKQPRFANGRSVRNALDRARMRHAVRLAEAGRQTGTVTKHDLVTIGADDIRGSRVFVVEQITDDGREGRSRALET